MKPDNPDQNDIWNILLVDDDEDDFIITQDLLDKVQEKRIRVEWAEKYDAALDLMKKKDWDAVLVDFDLGDRDGIQLIQEAASEGIEGPFIMVTGRGNHDKDLEAMEVGASDYVTKMELSSPLLERVIRYAIEHQRIEQELERRVQERTEELQTALEELTVMEEELRVQFDELAEVYSRQDAENARYKELYVFAPMGYLVTDQHGLILEANLAAGQLLNTARKFLLGKPLSTYISDESKNYFRGRLSKLSQAKGLQDWKLEINPRQLDPVLVRIVASPMRDQVGNLFAIRWLMLTERAAPD
jgi:DNA-binding response OmpR family regulator